eukprot:3055624-Pyramimonas_sp.AAC.1
MLWGSGVGRPTVAGGARRSGTGSFSEGCPRGQATVRGLHLPLWLLSCWVAGYVLACRGNGARGVAQGHLAGRKVCRRLRPAERDELGGDTRPVRDARERLAVPFLGRTGKNLSV